MSNYKCEHSGIEFETNDGWEKVIDRIPKMDKKILVYVNGSFDIGSPIKICDDDHSDVAYMWMLMGDSEGKVTHWRELPEPPNDSG